MSTEDGSAARFRITQAVAGLELTLRGPQRPLRHLEDVRHAQLDLADAIDLLSAAARRDGASWADIGRALGVSRQAARQAAIARGEHQAKVEEDKVWNMPLTRRRRNFGWLRRWRERRKAA